MTVVNVDLPEPGSQPVEVARVSRKVRRAFAKANKVMLRNCGAGATPAALAAAARLPHSVECFGL